MKGRLAAQPGVLSASCSRAKQQGGEHLLNERTRIREARCHLWADTIIPGDHSHFKQLIPQPIRKGPVPGLPGTRPFGHQLLYLRVIRFIIKIEDVDHGIDAGQGLQYFFSPGSIDVTF